LGLPVLAASLVLASAAAPERWAAGIVAGDPVGLSGRIALIGPLAAQLELGWSTSERRDLTGAFDLVFDLDGTMPDLGDRGSLVPWFGFGVRLSRQAQEPELVPALRAPVGISFLEQAPPVEIALTVAPGFELVAPQRASLEGGLIVRIRW
jgi:hypothetical protein